MKLRIRMLVAVATVLGGPGGLVGCATMGGGHGALTVQAKTSTAIFVDPVPRAQRTIYLDVKSGVEEFDRREFQHFVSEQFAQNEKGYRLVDDPTDAQFVMVAYVLNLEKASAKAAQEAVDHGYGYGNLMVAGAIVGGVVGHSWKGAVIGAAGGGLIAHLTSGHDDDDASYMLVCDVQIMERAAPGVEVNKATHIETTNSDTGKTYQDARERTNRKEYRTRIVTTANRELTESRPAMFRKVGYAMSGFF